MASATRPFFFFFLHSLRRPPYPPSASPLLFVLNSNRIHRSLVTLSTTSSFSTTTATITTSNRSSSRKNNGGKKNRRKTQKNQDKEVRAVGASAESLALLKRRTRSQREFDQQHVQRYGDIGGHMPVMLGEVLEVFATCPWRPLHSFVDCTLGAAGHSSAIIQAHPELKLHIGLDVDPIAHEKAQNQINVVLNKDSGSLSSKLKVYTLLKNFKEIKSVLSEIDEQLLIHGVDGILMDLGMSSMQVNDVERGFSVLNDGPLDMRMNPQASLKAEDILNSWPGDEVGRILQVYGEESNWRSLQAKIVKARLSGGLHSTRELVNLVKSTSPKSGGRQGWIKTATRVFQALRIAVNDELKTLEDALYACFDCLSCGGRLAVISFHSLEDRIVKQTFLHIINMGDGDGSEVRSRVPMQGSDGNKEETWIKQRTGKNGIILTKRPITPTEEEERLNRRCRSAKLRVVEKVRR